MRRVGDLLRYDDKRVVVTGCASGIGAQLCAQLADLGADVVGLDRITPNQPIGEFIAVDLADPDSIDRAAGSLGPRVDALFNVAGVSSGIGNPMLVVRINFLGTRHLTESVLPLMTTGSSIVSVASLAGSAYREHRDEVAGLLATTSMADGIRWCERHPDALADGGYRLSKEALIAYTVCHAEHLAARGIRINCTGPGVTETPILEQLRSAYGQGFLDTIDKPLGRVSDPDEQAAVLAFLASPAAGYITGQVIWVDGGALAARQSAEFTKGADLWQI